MDQKFAGSAYRNPEWQAIRTWLTGLAQSEPDQLAWVLAEALEPDIVVISRIWKTRAECVCFMEEEKFTGMVPRQIRYRVEQEET